MEDIEKRRERQRRYRQTERYKENRRKYTKTKEFKEQARKYIQNYRKANPEKMLQYERKQMKKLRVRVFEYLGGEKCKRCSCTVFEALQVNHINLGGHKEIESKAYPTYLRSILKAKRRDEFEVLCIVCNAAHYAEKRFGLKYEIKWLPP